MAVAVAVVAVAAEGAAAVEAVEAAVPQRRKTRRRRIPIGAPRQRTRQVRSIPVGVLCHHRWFLWIFQPDHSLRSWIRSFEFLIL